MAPTYSNGQEMVSIYLIKIKITTKFFKLVLYPEYNLDLFQNLLPFSTPQPLRAVGYCFHAWCPDGWAGIRAGDGKKFVRAISQKL